VVSPAPLNLPSQLNVLDQIFYEICFFKVTNHIFPLKIEIFKTAKLKRFKRYWIPSSRASYETFPPLPLSNSLSISTVPHPPQNFIKFLTLKK